MALLKENLSISIVSLIIREIQLIDSLVGTRKDLREVLEFAKLHRIACKIEKCLLKDVNDVFDRMYHFRISGRVVIDFTAT